MYRLAGNDRVATVVAVADHQLSLRCAERCTYGERWCSRLPTTLALDFEREVLDDVGGDIEIFDREGVPQGGIGWVVDSVY